RAPSLTLACVGDLMLDRFVYGEVSRISPEAPVPVLRTHRSVSMPGGVGNVARNLASLGTRVTLGSVAGQDVEGRALADLLAAEPGLTDAVRYTDTARTVVKTRYVAAGQQLLRLDEEDTLDTDYAGEGVFEGADAILISDYAKGVVSDALIAAALAHAAQAGVPVIVDPKGRDFARYGAVDLIKPNAAELAG
ncbi:MAG TPA: bifunctional heptose 7-phosphate kinase/heptose 1-phosphate adenyltransferase, partial [Brevundimonas sp.]|nr:bifunctional heptose 7-phosphate kinase/heptose 1-phosphate adenyltransferase [Brevundimonas sp.]